MQNVKEVISENPILSGIVAAIQDLKTLPEVKEKMVDVIEQQTLKGLAKYGQAVNADALETVEWIEHLIEELGDSVVYAQTIIEKGKLGEATRLQLLAIRDSQIAHLQRAVTIKIQVIALRKASEGECQNENQTTSSDSKG